MEILVTAGVWFLGFCVGWGLSGIALWRGSASAKLAHACQAYRDEKQRADKLQAALDDAAGRAEMNANDLQRAISDKVFIRKDFERACHKATKAMDECLRLRRLVERIRIIASEETDRERQEKAGEELARLAGVRK